MLIYFLGVLVSFIALAITYSVLEDAIKQEIANRFYGLNYENNKEKIDNFFRKALKKSLLVFPWFSWLNLFGMIYYIIKYTVKKSLW